VVYEALNLPEPVTCVFRGELAAVNRASRLLGSTYCMQ
jgi:hypothetical protein